MHSEAKKVLTARASGHYHPRLMPSLKWRVELGSWSELPGAEKKTCSIIVSEYGGALADEGRGDFRRYRAAEACANTLRTTLGATQKIRLTLAKV